MLNINQRISNRNLPAFLLYIFCSLLIVFSSYKIKNIFYIVHISFFVGAFFSMALLKDSYRILFSRYGAFTVALMLYYGIMYMISRGFPEYAVSIRYLGSALLLTKSLPFFILGFLLAAERKKLKIYLVVMIGSLAIISLYDIILMRGATSVYNRADMAFELMGGQVHNRVFVGGGMFGKALDDFIPYFPFISIVSLFSLPFVLQRNYSWRYRAVIGIGAILLIVNVAISGFVTPLLILLIGSIVLVLTLPKKPSSALLITAIFLGFVFLCYYILNNFEIGEANRVLKRFKLLFIGITEKGGEGLVNEASGGRLELIQVSLKTFSKYPLFGVGEQIGNGYGDKIIGAHSFFADTLAKYGIIGCIPIFGLYFSWLYYVVANFLKDRKDSLRVASLTVFAALTVGNIVNPYFITSYIDQITFLVGGLACGTHYLDMRCIPSPINIPREIVRRRYQFRFAPPPSH